MLSIFTSNSHIHCSGHQYLGDALEKYMLADANTYNFGQLKNIYLLNYVNGPPSPAVTKSIPFMFSSVPARPRALSCLRAAFITVMVVPCTMP